MTINNLEGKNKADLIEIINIQIEADQKRENRITELEEEKRRLIIARNEKGERIAELEGELKKSNDARDWETIAEHLLNMMDSKKIKNFTAKGFETSDGRQFEMIVGFVDGQTTADRLTEQQEQITELERERDERDAHIFRMITFVSRSIEKLKGIPEFEPTADVLERALQGTPKSNLTALKLEQQAKGVEVYDRPQITTTIVDDRLIVEIPADFLVNSFEMGIGTNIFGLVNDNQEMLKHFERAFKADDPCAFGYFIDSVCRDAIENGESFVDVDE